MRGETSIRQTSPKPCPSKDGLGAAVCLMPCDFIIPFSGKNK
jgi:hypothetical protein